MSKSQDTRDGAPKGHSVSPYYDLEHVAAQVRKGGHRARIGGAWDEIGRLQFEYLRSHGLEPEMRLLDVGCGSLRGGVHFARYLEVGHYYGIDLSQDLLDAGYDIELRQLGLQERVPRSNLLATAEFDAVGFGVVFDMLLAQSVFTHLTSNHIRLCLARMADVTRPGSVFFATVFLVPEGADAWGPVQQPPAGIVSYPAANPYHYRPADIASWVTDLPWRPDSFEEWGHPRGQQMATFVRTDGSRR